MPADRRTEPPTARRLRRARRDGDHPISPALIGLGSIACVVIFLPLALSTLFDAARQLLHQGLQPGVESQVSGLALRVAWLVCPIIGAAAAFALAIGLWQTGAQVSLKPLALDWQRVSPWKGAGRPWFGARPFAAVTFLGSVGWLSFVAWRVLESAAPALAASVGSASAATRVAGELCQRLLLWSLVVLSGMAALDAIAARIAWYERHRMTREEVRREQQESEGHPGLKQARQRAHQELLQSAESTQLGKSMVLVLGRPRLAVALTYDAAADAAPRVLIQASGAFARTLESLAPLYGVPLYEDAALARSLSQLAPNDEVPKAQYAAVAKALESALRSGSPGPTRA